MKTIMLIDDDRACLDMCSLILKEFGYNTIDCQCFTQASDMLQTITAPDLIISDFLGLDQNTGIGFFIESVMDKRIPFALWTGTIALEDETLVNEFKIFLKHLPGHIQVSFNPAQGVADQMLKVCVQDHKRHLTAEFPCFAKPGEINAILAYFKTILN